MEGIAVVGALVLGVVVLGLVIVRMGQQNLRRTERWEEAARARGFSLSEEPPPSVLAVLPQFDLFSRATSYQLRHVVQGEVEGCPFWSFDLTYQQVSGRGSNRTTTHLSTTCVLFHARNLAAPTATLVEEQGLQSFVTHFIGEKVELGAPPPFEWAYRRVAENGELIFTFPTNQLLFFYDDAAQGGQLGAEQWVLYHHAGQLLDPEQLGTFLSEGLQALDLFRQAGQSSEAEIPRR